MGEVQGASWNAILNILKSGLIAVAIISRHLKLRCGRNIIRYHEKGTYEPLYDNIFPDTDFGAHQTAKNAFIVVARGSERGPRKLWVRKMALLFKIQLSRYGWGEDFTFWHYRDCCLHEDALQRTIYCVNIRLGTTDEEVYEPLKLRKHERAMFFVEE